MDKIEFKINKKKVVDIYINGKNLIRILREIELPFAKKEGSSPSIAGSYEGLLPDEISRDVNFFKKNPKKYRFYRRHRKGRSFILTCKNCHEDGCWSMWIKIKAGTKTVTWSDFKCEHRDKWKYNLKFTFEKRQYVKEISKLGNDCKRYFLDLK